MNEVIKLSWDSDFFGFGVGKVIAHNLTPDLLKTIVGQMKEQKYKLVYCYTDPKDEISNKSLSTNYALVDEKITYAMPIPVKNTIAKNISSYLHKPKNNFLIALALTSGEYSRFKIDKHFAPGDYERLYTTWLENSLNGTIATDVLVYSEDDHEVGLLTLCDKNRLADIGLLAVDKKYRGKDIGTNLIHAAFKRAEALGFKEIQVVTQRANKGACIFYGKVGFLIKRVENIYHIWV